MPLNKKIFNHNLLLTLLIFLIILIGAITFRFINSHQKLLTIEKIPPIPPNPTTSLQPPSSGFDFNYFNKVQVTNGVKHIVPLNKIISGGPPKDGIPSIDNPKFVSIQEADRYLDDDKFGQAIDINGQQRFYPYQILVWHEIVNDTIGDLPIAVTYCPLCQTGIIYDRRIPDIGTVEFGTSGKLWNSNLVMYDRTTETYWSQIIGKAIKGPLAGTDLKIIPSTILTYGNWKKSHPQGQVLSNQTGFFRDYTDDPYIQGTTNYYTSTNIWFPIDNIDNRLSPKEFIYGIIVDDTPKAYSQKKIKEAGVINDEIGTVKLLILWDPQEKTVRFFERPEEKFQLIDNKLQDETGNQWDFQGRSLNTPSKSLKPFPFKGGFWFAWSAIYPQTLLYQ